MFVKLFTDVGSFIIYYCGFVCNGSLPFLMSFQSFIYLSTTTSRHLGFSLRLYSAAFGHSRFLLPPVIGWGMCQPHFVVCISEQLVISWNCLILILPWYKSWTLRRGSCCLRHLTSAGEPWRLCLGKSMAISAFNNPLFCIILFI